MSLLFSGKNVLIVLPFPPDTGADGRKKDAIETLLKAHKNIGFNVIAVSLQPEFNNLNPIYSCTPLCFKFITSLKNNINGKITRKAVNWLWRQALLSAIIMYQKKAKIDLTFAYSMSLAPSIFSHRMWKKLCIPYAINEHRTDYQRLKKSGKSLTDTEIEVLENASFVLALTEPHRKHINYFVDRKIDVMPLVLEREFFEPPALIGQKQAKSITIAAWTNWREIKRLDILIESMAIVVRRFPNIKLVVAGPIPSESQLSEIRTKIRNYDLGGYVELNGSMPKEKIKMLAYECDLCVIPSDHETFGLPASEALSAGKPVVTTRCGGPEVFIIEGFNGFVVEPGSKDALAEGICKALQSMPTFNMRDIAKDAQSKFSIESLENALVKIYSNEKL